MARRRQTETAVLGALSVAPMTGYAIREAIRDVLGHFWSESFGQIYPTLAQLVDDGYATKTAIASGSGRTGSSTFSITSAGQEHLKELLSEPIQANRPRDGLLLRLFFGRQLGVDACRELLQQTRADASERLDAFAAIRSEMASEEEEFDADQPYWLLTLSAGEHSARAAIAWADESIAALEELT